MPPNEHKCDPSDYEYESEDDFVNGDPFTHVHITSSKNYDSDNRTSVQIDMLSARIPPEFTYSPPAANAEEPLESSDAVTSTVTPVGGVALPPLPRAYINIDAGGNLRPQMRRILKKQEQDFWYNMYSPKQLDVEKAAHKALDGSSDNEVHSESENLTPKRKRKKLQRDQNTSNSKPKGGEKKVKTDEYYKRDNLFGDFSSVDITVFGSLQTRLICDGVMRDGLYLPKYDAQAVCDQIQKKRCSATKAANQLGFIPPEATQILPPNPCSVYDCNGVRLVFYLPGLLGPKAKETYFQELLALFATVKLSTCQADAKGRGSGYVFEVGRFTGCLNMAYAWRALLQKAGTLMSSKQVVNGGQTSVAKSAIAFSTIQAFHANTRNIGVLMNYTLFRCHPESFWAYLKMSAKVRQGVPAAAAVAVHEPALSSGKSIIVSRATKCHADTKEHPAGWSLLVVIGSCKTGMLAIPRLGVQFHYLPGTVVLLRWRLLEHEVVEWDGKDYRICVAYLTHMDEWLYADVIPPL